MPLATAPLGLVTEISLPSRIILPAVLRAAPMRRRAVSVLPAPMSPAKPRISPRRRSKETSRMKGGPESPSTLRTTSPEGRSLRVEKKSFSSRPTIRPMSSSIVAFLGSSSPAFSPSRSTTIRSVTPKTSSSLCEMKMTAMPLALSSAMTLKSLLVSFVVREEVGSSMTRSLTSVSRALAISIICWIAVEKRPTGTLRSNSMSRRSKMAPARSRITPKSRSPARFLISRPRKRFSRALRLGQLLSSWKMIEMPCLLGLAYGLEVPGRALPQELAAVGAVDPREDLHERRLARAVLAEQADHLAPPRREIDLPGAPARRGNSWRCRASRAARARPRARPSRYACLADLTRSSTAARTMMTPMIAVW